MKNAEYQGTLSCLQRDSAEHEGYVGAQSVGSQEGKEQDDAYYDNDDDYEPRCYSCHCRRTEHRVIHDYYYKPEPEFLGQGSRFFGVELEVDGAGESNGNAARIVDIANFGAERIYIKHDGSLNDGFEMVTHPMTLDYHLGNMPWSEILTTRLCLFFALNQRK